MKIHVVKMGGRLIHDKKLLNISISYFCKLKGSKILVHGGGSKADYFLDQMNIPKKIIQGRRITDKTTLDIVVMTYAGVLNKNIVSLLQYYHCNAIGLCGADGNCIKSYIREKVNDINYGYVGDIKESKDINTNFIKLLLRNNITPVFCSITHDGMGNLLNTNADTIASNIAVSLSKQKCSIELHFCFDKIGVLRKIDDSNSYFRKINFSLFQEIIQNNFVFGGMIPKLENAFFALKNGVSKVSIGLPNYLMDSSKKTILCL
ncbi:acetylglutamate kinase [Blattabacterium cuenoti]|uniref:acetylglutamate kinase n=1 Tax=Blattabacterium cuenoti TaxID=1653831 RepID=UPI00163CAD39|nr:acetylglutamate kinase [Blattabacterium cuenoti]